MNQARKGAPKRKKKLKGVRHEVHVSSAGPGGFGNMAQGEGDAMGALQEDWLNTSEHIPAQPPGQRPGPAVSCVGGRTRTALPGELLSLQGKGKTSLCHRHCCLPAQELTANSISCVAPGFSNWHHGLGKPAQADGISEVICSGIFCELSERHLPAVPSVPTHTALLVSAQPPCQEAELTAQTPSGSAALGVPLLGCISGWAGCGNHLCRQTQRSVRAGQCCCDLQWWHRCQPCVGTWPHCEDAGLQDSLGGWRREVSEGCS